MRRPFLLLALGLLIPTSASAQGGSEAIFGLGVGSSELADLYVSFNGGGMFRLSPFVVSATFELDIAEEPDREGRYIMDSSLDRCRDSQTGQFAATKKCRETVLFYAAVLDVGYPILRNLIVGAGFRAGEGSTPFLSSMYVFNRDSQHPIQVHVSAWAAYVSLSARFRFNF